MTLVTAVAERHVVVQHRRRGHAMRKSAVAAAITLVLVGAACGDGDGKAGEQSLARSGAAEVTSGAAGIMVTGTGEVRGRPDTLTMSLGVRVTRPTVAVASGDAAAATDGVLASLSAAGVAKEDIQTVAYSIYPQYGPPTSSQTQPQVSGYTVSNVVRVKIRDIAKAGPVIDAAVAAGGNETVVQGVAFSLEDASESIGQARERAWADASAKATALARLAGVPLGAAVEISESTDGGVVRAVSEASAVATPIEPGQVTTSVVITVRFAFGG
jgi:uncharacterized protein YggE